MNTDLLKITKQISIPAPIDLVWDFLLDEEQMKNWFNAAEFIIDAIEGGNIEIPISINGEELCAIGEIGLIFPKEKFVFTWLERDQDNETWFNNTTITIQLEGLDTGTALTLIHDGFKYLPDNEQIEIFEDYRIFWDQNGILERLPALIASKS